MSHTRLYLAGSALLTCLLTWTPAFADDDAKSKSQDSDQAKASEQWISDLSSKVKLTSDQKDQIRQKLDSNQKEIESTWKKFSEANAKAIALEATLYAAIEDGMTDQQKQQFRENRENKNSPATAADKLQKPGSQKPSPQKPSKRASAADDKDAKNDQPAAATDDKEAKNDKKGQVAAKANKNKSSQNEASDTAKQSGGEDPAYVYVTEMIIVPVQQLVSDVNMDDSQRNQCDQACQQFHSKLHKAWSDVSRYHDKLVQLEAKNLQAIEGVLDEGQLQKLKKSRSGNG